MSSNLPLVPEFIERFITNWSFRRHPTAENKIKINQHRLYILPTKHGLAYFIVLLLVLFGSINYENSLGFMLTFLLVSLGFISMIYTHQNINQLKVNINRAEPVFAGQDIYLPVIISHSHNTTRPALQLQSDSGQKMHVHLLNDKTIECKLPFTTRHRGYIKSHNIKLYSEYPLGLFHAWSWMKLQSQCLIYPAPAPQHFDLQLAGKNTSGQSFNNKQGMDNFAGIRLYQIGDSPNHMAWKAIAKTGELQTKIFNTETTDEIWIEWSQTKDTLGTEQRLSILCRLVIDASEKNINFGLHIPGKKITPSCGLQHKNHCLKALALFRHDE